LGGEGSDLKGNYYGSCVDESVVIDIS